MERGLFAYLDDLPCGSIQSSPEYDYLGHFRESQWIEAGHNELGMEQQIEAGNIPDLHASGSNTPAESEPGNISNEGSQAPSMTQPGPGPQSQSSGLVKGAIEAPIKEGITGGIKSLFSGL